VTRHSEPEAASEAQRRKRETSGTESMPIYARIQTHLRERIGSGEYGPGDRLPSEMALADQFKTTRSTVVHAMQLLVFEGLVSREAGRGTFVRQRPIPTTLDAARIRSFEDEIVEAGARIDYKLLAFSLESAEQSAAERLRVAPESEIYHMRRLRIVDGTPAVLENRFIPVEIAERMSIEDLRQRPMYDILEMSVGRPVARVDGIINAVAAVPDVAKILRIAQGTPILVRDYTLADRGGAPLVCGETSYRTQYPIRYTVVQSSNG